MQTCFVTLRSFLIQSHSGGRFPRLCAVTASDPEDALGLFKATYSRDGLVSQALAIDELSPAEIQRRIGNADFGIPIVRGIWYPHLENP